METNKQLPIMVCRVGVQLESNNFSPMDLVTRYLRFHQPLRMSCLTVIALFIYLAGIKSHLSLTDHKNSEPTRPVHHKMLYLHSIIGSVIIHLSIKLIQIEAVE